MKVSELAQLKKNTDLATVASTRGIKLVRQGGDFVACCPFHEEQTPSFHITPAKNLFHCFGCGAAGSVIDFVMRLDNIPFKEAVSKLLAESGVVQRVAEIEPAPSVEGLSPERARLLLERVVEVYQKNLAESPEAKAYLEKRSITDMGLLTQHRMGCSNGKLVDLLPNEGPVWQELESLGVLLSNHQERFEGCIVVPVFDLEGRLATLYGRNTVESEKRHLFLPGRPTGLWNIAAVKSHSHIILVESVLDGLSVQMAGHPNVVAIQGVNGLSAADVDLMLQQGVQRVTLLLDGDDAGQAAARKLQELLIKHGMSCDKLTLPPEDDPNSYLTAHGAPALANFISSAPAAAGKSPGLQALPDGFAVTLGLRRYEIRGLEKGARKLKATVRVEHMGKLHVDTLDFYQARARRLLAQDLTRLFDQSAETIEADMTRLMTLCESHQETGAVEGILTQPADAITHEARKEAEAFGRHKDLIERIHADYEVCGLVGEKANKILCYLAAVSRKMERPLSVLILSSSGAGKTALQDAALMFCPPEDVVKLTSLSGKALFYKEQTSLKNKVLALEEGDGMQDAQYAIRNLISAGELVIESTIKDMVTGRLTTMENRVEGPTSVFITTTNPETDPETKSRFFVTSVDESREQTQAILSFQRRRHTLVGLSASLDLDPLLQRHRNFQRLLKPLSVVNPYADQLSYGDDRLQGRRDQPKYLNLINAVAFVRQMQKPVKTWEAHGQTYSYIEVEREDIQIANTLANQIIGHSLSELSRPGYELLMLLEAMTAKGKSAAPASGPRIELQTFSRRDIREYAGWSNARVHRYLKELIELEYILIETGRNGSLHRYRLMYEGQGKQGERFLLGLRSVDELQS